MIIGKRSVFTISLGQFPSPHHQNRQSHQSPHGAWVLKECSSACLLGISIDFTFFPISESSARNANQCLEVEFLCYLHLMNHSCGLGRPIIPRSKIWKIPIGHRDIFKPIIIQPIGTYFRSITLKKDTHTHTKRFSNPKGKERISVTKSRIK